MLRELRNFGLGPGMKAVALDGDCANGLRRIIRTHSDLDSVLHQGAQRISQRVCRPWLVGSCGDQPDHMLALQQRSPLVAMLAAKPINYVAVAVLSGRTFGSECRGCEITGGQGAKGTGLY